MACYHPGKAFDTGLLNENGKRVLFVTFVDCDHVPLVDVRKRLKVDIPPNSEYLTPYGTDKALYRFEPVPCGKCIGCRLDYSRSWAVRCCLENEYSSNTHFITLTYDDAYLPKNGKVSKREFQLFMKRFRKHFPDAGIRFFACGEYGDKTLRPHYHAIIFNSPLDDLTRLPKAQESYRSKTLEDLWPFGMCEVDPFNFASAAYVARYCMKKTKTLPGYEPFTLMSRRPGIGVPWLDDHPDFFKDHNEVYGDFGGMNKAGIPPLYVRKLEDKYGAEWKEAIKAYKKMLAISSSNCFMASHSAPFPNADPLEYQENLKKSQIESLKRRL